MLIRRLSGANGTAATEAPPDTTEEFDWSWIDVQIDPTSTLQELQSTIGDRGLDDLALSDVFHEANLPKLDVFADQLHVVIHGVAPQAWSGDSTVEPTYEIDCFLTEDCLITIHNGASPSIDAFATLLPQRPELSEGGTCEIFARLVDVVARRFLVVLDDLDNRLDALSVSALEASPTFLEELTRSRETVAEFRRILRPQREVVDQLRRTTSTLVTDGGRRRFADVFDIAQRSVQELEGSRSTLAETLGAYQGAEARRATEITRVLTIYAAIMLPLSLIAGVFGMNFVSVPGGTQRWGWWIIVGLMLLVAVTSLALFSRAGWIGRSAARPVAATDQEPAVELAASLFRRSSDIRRKDAPRRARFLR